MAQTTEIIGCRKTAVSHRYDWVGGGLVERPPYSVEETTVVFGKQTTTVTTYKIFTVEYDKGESSEKIWKCPHCNEDVKIINRKPGARSQEQLKLLEEENIKHRRKWLSTLSIISIVFWILYIINPNNNNLTLAFIITGLAGVILFIFVDPPFKKSIVFEEQESGSTTIENSQTHGFLVPEKSALIDFGHGMIGHESPQPTRPETRHQIVGKIIHKVLPAN